MSLKALQLGAADYVPKPDASEGPAALTAFFDELKLKIKGLARAKGAAVQRAASMARTTLSGVKQVGPVAIAIGSSTGGPTALLKVCERIRGALKTPLFITQHMPPTFTALLAEQLSQAAGVPACEGADGMIAAPGRIYVAPGGRHMLAERALAGVTIRLSDAPPEHFCKPAVDPMFRSLARAYGPGLLAIVLTGMGRDGADGCVAVADAGGNFIAQDEATSVVYGMPGAAFRTGRAMAQLPLEDIGAYLAGVMGRGR
jgi:two-component system chemotaxis response regulator CheB